MPGEHIISELPGWIGVSQSLIAPISGWRVTLAQLGNSPLASVNTSRLRRIYVARPSPLSDSVV